MTTMRRDPLVDDYLARLEAAAAHLPRRRRAELVGEIEEHVEDALAESGDDETAVRNVLERLGSPEEIAAAAGDAPPERGALERAALIVLCLSFVLPLVGYVIGAGLVLSSRAWAERDKLIGLLLAPAVVFAAAVAVILVAEAVGGLTQDTSAIGPVELVVLAVYFLSGLAAAGYLSHRLRRL
jgi:HAAS